MATLEGNPSFTQFLAWKLGKALDKRADKAKYRAATVTQTIIKLMLHIVGFSCLTLAAFLWSIIAGLVVAGISCFVFSWLLSATETPERPQQTLR